MPGKQQSHPHAVSAHFRHFQPVPRPGAPVPSIPKMIGCPMSGFSDLGMKTPSCKRVVRLPQALLMSENGNLTPMPSFGLDARETRILKSLKTPERIQRFLDTEIAYNKEPDGDTIRSPRRVLRDKVAHCFEGALFGAAALRVQDFPPLLLDLESVRDDDHVLAIFKQHGHWG